MAVEQIARLMQRASDALAAAGYGDVTISMPTFPTLVAQHANASRAALAQAVLDALNKSTRSPRSLNAIYTDVTNAGLTAAEHQTALRAVLAYLGQADPDAMKKLGGLIPKLANILGDAPGA